MTYTSLTIRPCKHEDENNTVQCDKAEAEFFTIYGVDIDGMLEAIGDFKTEEDAECVTDALLHLNNDIAYAAMCAWEYVLESQGEYWGGKQLLHGACALRFIILEIVAPKLETAFITVSKNYTDCFDWEFVPNVLDLLADPIRASQEEYNRAAQIELKRTAR